jgi:hypothetical protein
MSSSGCRPARSTRPGRVAVRDQRTAGAHARNSGPPPFRNPLTHPWVRHRAWEGGQRPPSESIARAMTASGER